MIENRSQLHAAEEPLWEFGLGIGAIAFEDYRGSNTSHVYPLPVPYLIYNGPFLKADRDGVRGMLFNQHWVELNVSVNATTPVQSDRARSGMPGLKSTIEVGPSLEFHLLRSADSRYRFDLRLPVRGRIGADGKELAALQLEDVDVAGCGAPGMPEPAWPGVRSGAGAR